MWNWQTFDPVATAAASRRNLPGPPVGLVEHNGFFGFRPSQTERLLAYVYNYDICRLNLNSRFEEVHT